MKLLSIKYNKQNIFEMLTFYISSFFLPPLHPTHSPSPSPPPFFVRPQVCRTNNYCVFDKSVVDPRPRMHTLHGNFFVFLHDASLSFAWRNIVCSLHTFIVWYLTYPSAVLLMLEWYLLINGGVHCILWCCNIMYDQLWNYMK